MTDNFNQWRVAQQATFSGGGLEHYHRCEDAIFAYVRTFLYSIIKKRIDTGARSMTIRLSSELIETLFIFLQEMEFSYIHPRSTSAKFYFSRKTDTANPNT